MWLLRVGGTFVAACATVQAAWQPLDGDLLFEYLYDTKV